MNFRKYWFGGKRSIGIAAGCMLAMGFGALNANAATLPFTFTPGAIAKAADVNANFQALNSALPTVLGSSTLAASPTLALTATAQNITPAISATAPAAGAAVITASGTVCANHAAGTQESVALQILVDGTNYGQGPQQYVVPAAQGTGLACIPFSFSTVIAALGAGTHLIAMQGQNGSGSAYVAGATLSAILYH